MSGERPIPEEIASMEEKAAETITTSEDRASELREMQVGSYLEAIGKPIEVLSSNELLSLHETAIAFDHVRKAYVATTSGGILSGIPKGKTTPIFPGGVAAF